MDYGKLVSRAWSIVWRNKFLFVLGFLAALGGSGQSPQYSYQFSAPSSPGGRGGEWFLRELAQFWNQHGGLMLGLAALALVLGLCAWLVRLTAEAGMIESVYRIEAGERATLGGSLRQGMSHLARMLGLSLVLYGPVWLVGALMAIAGVVFAAAALGAQTARPLLGMGIVGVCLLPVACLGGLYTLVMTFIYPFAQRSIILKKLGVVEGIRDGWGVLRANLGDILLLALLFLVIGFVVSVVAGLVTLPLALVAMLPALRDIINTGIITSGQIILSFVTFLGAALISAVILSILRALRSTAFTLAYQEFTMAKAAPVGEGDN